MHELNIIVNHAHSPQAKGRVERANETLQDRLIKELRLAGISSIAAANQFLRESNYLDKHNSQFAVAAVESGNGHRPADLYDLDRIFCIREKRVLANDYTIVYNKRIFQLTARQRTIIRPKDVIIVNTYLDGSIRLSTRNTHLFFEEINQLPPKIIEEKKVIYKPFKHNANSRRWASGLPPQVSQQESWVKLAVPVIEAK